MRARLPVALATTVALLTIGGCGESADPVQEVLRAIEQTERSAKVLSYTEVTTTGRADVTVRLEDAFRYEVRAGVGGRDLLQEAVRDDAIAVRSLAPEVFNPGEGTPAGEMLADGSWVQDPAGAPAVYIVGRQEERGQRRIQVGVDPVSDALNVLEYVRTAIQEGQGVDRFNEDAIDYIPAQDPFRGFVDADQEAGVRRFDVGRSFLPRNAQEANRIPGSDAFRKMAIYVKDGRVVRVLEEIDVEGHEQIVDAREEGEPEFLLDLVKAIEEGRGDETIRPREMAAVFDELDSTISTALPTEAQTANLGEIIGSGSLHKFPGAEGGLTFEPDLDGEEDGGAVAGLSPDDLPSRG